MPPLFTSRAEWHEHALEGERAYVRTAVGFVVSGALIGLSTMVIGIGAVDPYWRSLPILLTFAGSLTVCSALSALLFRREYRAAARAYGLPVETGARAI